MESFNFCHLDSFEGQFFKILLLKQKIYISFLFRNYIMGNQCSCTLAEKVQPEIVNQKTMSPRQQTQHSIHTLNEQPQQDRTNTITHSSKEVPQEEIQQAQQQPLQQPLQLPTKRNLKRVQLVLPTQGENDEQKHSDNVRYLSGSIKTQNQLKILQVLEKHCAMSQLTKQEKKQVIEEMEYCKALKNEYVFKKGDPSSSFYILLQGQCQVIVDESTRRKIGDGQSFGDLGILYNAPRSASIFVLEECLLARLNRKNFLKTLDKINEEKEKENKRILASLEFYKQLNQQQKNTLAAHCISLVFQASQVIFNKGDDSNAFYIIRSGTVEIVEKGIELKKNENFGLNSFLQEEKAVRSSTIRAKTKCLLLSITKATIKTKLGGNIMNIIKRNIVEKLISQSCLNKQISSRKLKDLLNRTKFQKITQGSVVFRKNQKIKSITLHIVLNTQLRSGNKIVQANSLISPQKILKREAILFEDDFIAQSEGFLGILQIPQSILKKNEQAKQNKQKKNLNIEDFYVVRILKSGSFGQVYATYNVKTKQKYAIKVMDKNYLNKEKMMKFVLREKLVLREIKPHPFVLQYHDAINTSRIIGLILELIEGEDFFEGINSQINLKLDDIPFYAAQILLAIQHLHNQKFIYRDLKPENLMVCTDGYIKLVDMGTVKELTIQDKYKTKTIIGTPHYMAPWILTGKGYSFQVDLWSFGIMIYELTFGQLPFGENQMDPFKIYKEIITGNLYIPQCMDKEKAKNLIKKLLNKSPQHQDYLEIQEIKKNEYFDQIDFQALLQKRIPPEYRPSPSNQIADSQIQRSIAKKKKAMKIFLSRISLKL